MTKKQKKDVSGPDAIDKVSEMFRSMLGSRHRVPRHDALNANDVKLNSFIPRD